MANKEIFDLMTQLDPGTDTKLEKRNISLPKMLMAGAKSPTNPMQGVLNYLNETPLSEEDYKYLREKAALIGSDEWTAMAPFTSGIFAIDNLITGKRGGYRGQDRGRTKEQEAAFAKAKGLKVSPNLLDIYLGNTTAEKEGLKKIEGSDSYDANPYVKFEGFSGNAKNRHNLLKAVTYIKPGQSINIDDYNINAVTNETIDFGRKSWKIEKDKEGQAFLVMDDKWDFAGGDYGPQGKILDKLGAANINLKVKVPLDLSHFNYPNY